MKLSITGRPEPLLNRALIVAVVSALLTLLEAFGVPLTVEQQSAINQFLAVLAPVIVALLARAHITPVSDPKAYNVSGKLVDLSPTDGSTLKDQ